MDLTIILETNPRTHALIMQKQPFWIQQSAIQLATQILDTHKYYTTTPPLILLVHTNRFSKDISDDKYEGKVQTLQEL